MDPSTIVQISGSTLTLALEQAYIQGFALAIAAIGLVMAPIRWRTQPVFWFWLTVWAVATPVYFVAVARLAELIPAL